MFWNESFLKYAEITEPSALFKEKVYPAVVRNVTTDDILCDFGGGIGSLLVHLRHCKEVWLYDPAKACVDYAVGEGRVRLDRAIASYEDLPKRYFTVVVSSFVLMNARSSREECLQISQVRNLMRSDARALFIITDPRNRAEEFSIFRAELENGDEWKLDGLFYVNILNNRRESVLRISNYHRPLPVTLANICASHLEVWSIESIADFSRCGFYNRDKTPYLLIVARST